MTFEEIRKRHGLGSKDTETSSETTSKPSTSVTTKTPSSQGIDAYNEIRNRYGVGERFKVVDDNYINAFISDVNKYASADEKSSYSEWNKLNLGSRASTIQGWLQYNKSNLDEETYKGYSDYIDGFIKLNDVFSQFKDEDEYNSWFEQNKRDEEMLAFDLEAGKAEIDALQEKYDSYTIPENELNGIKATEKLITDLKAENQQLEIYRAKGHRESVEKYKKNEEKIAQYQAILDEAYAKWYGGRDELASMISQKNQYYTLASRMQKAAELSSVFDVNSENYDPQFNEYSTLGNHISWENVGDKTTKNGIAIYDDVKAAALVMNERWLGIELYTEDMVKPKSGIKGFFEGLTGLSEYNTENTEKINIFRKMSDNELMTFAYYLKKDEETGSCLAKEYIESIKESLNAQRGQDIAASKDTDFSKYLFGVEAGLDQFFEGRDALFSDADYIPTSATQYASGIIREDLKDSGPKLPDWLGGASLGQVGYDAITTTSNMLPSMLTSAVVGTINPALGTAVGSTLLGASAAGNAKAEMLNLGYSKEQATTYGIMVGVAEGSMEYFLGHIPGLSKGDGIFSTLASKAVSKVDNALARVAIAIGGSFDEALEEGLQTIIEPWLKEIATNVDWDDPTVDEVLYSSLLGALSSIGLQGGAGAINAGANTVLKNQEIKAHGQDIIVDGGVDTLKQLALDMAGVNQNKDGQKLATLAGKVESKASAKNVGKLSAKMEDTVIKQNRTDIQKALVEKGLSEKDAKRVSEYLGSNKALTEKQKAEIEGNESIKAVEKELLNNSKSDISERGRNLLAARLGVDMKNAKVNASKSGELSLRNDVDVKERISETGKTTIATTDENGKSVEVEVAIDKKNPIAKVKYVNDERIVYLNTDHGKVEASNVKYANEEEGLLYEAFVDMNPAFANAVIKNYDGSVPIQTYINGMREGMILYGMHNFQAVGKDISKNSYLADLSEADQAFALKLGKAYAEADAKKANTNLRTAIKNAAEKAKASEGASTTEATQNKPKKGKVSFEDGAKIETHKQHRRVVALAKHLASAIGIDIVFYDSMKTGKKAGQGANGYFDEDTDTIYLDLQNAQDDAKTIAYTLSHELVHFIKKWSPQKFNTFAEFLMKQYASHGVSTANLLKQKMVELNTTDADLAYEEMICDACETMLLDSNAVVKLMELRKSDLELFEKIKLHVLKILNDIREAYKKLGYQPTSDEAKALLGMKDVLEQFYSMFEEAAVDATKTYQTVKNLDSKIASDSNIKKQAKALQRKDPTKLKEDDLINLLQYSKSKLFTDGSYIPVRVNTPQILIAFAKEMGYTLENFPMAMSVYKARQAVSNIEEWDGDPKDTPHDLEPTEVVEIIRAMNNPSYLVFQTKNERFAEIVKFDKGKEKAYAIIDFFDVNKNAEIMNGYKGGKYNILVTVYPSEDAQDLKDYLKDKRNKVITGEEMKKKGLSQRGLGSYVPAHLNDSPFFEDIITEEKPIVKKQLKKTSENGELSLQNLTADELLSKWQSKQKELSEASYEQDELEDSDEYKTLIKTLVDSGVSPDSIANYNAWNEKTGYSKLVDRVKLLAKEARELSALYDKAISDKYVKEEQEAIAKSGLTEADYFRKQAVKEFGYTPYFYDAGYLLPNGRMLNFSGEKGQHYGMRGQDHRAIGTIYANLEGSEAMLKFMEEGNIRVMAETPGIDLSVTLEPTKEQYDTISRFVTQSKNKGYFCVDLSDAKGNVIGSLEYENSFSSVRVINDIKTYFKTGEIREQSSVAKFHYQKKKDSQGNILSEGQQEFFKDSKVRDKNGNLLVMYHGTPNAGFTKFREGSYFTEHKWYADRYQNRSASSLSYKQSADNPDTYAVYLNIKKPFDTRNPEEAHIFNNEYLGHYGMGTPLMESGLPDWLDGMDLQEFIEEMGYDYDGLILDEGSVGGYGDEVVNRGLSYVIFDPAQAKNIDNKTPTSDPDIRFQKKRNPSSYAPTFYSQMGREIDAIKMDKVGATSLVNYLKGKGIKHDEIKWSGIEAFLEGKKSVTKAELQEFLAGSQLTIEEEMSGAESFDIIKDGEDYVVKDKNGNVLDTWRRTEAPDDPELKGWISDEEGDIVSTIEEIREYSSDWYGNAGTRWSQYRLDGGSNYRELVFKMPNSSYSNNAMQAHWGQDAEGVLAHARIQDMTTSDGKRMLFIEEIQSDWHNEGHKEGYVNKLSPSEELKLQKLREEKKRLFEEMRRIAKEDGQSDEFDRVYDQEHKIGQEIESMVGTDNSIPDAPFRDTYHEYVLKRLIRMAAEEGYDSIGWTPAEIQSKRWSDEFAEGYRIEYDQDIPKFLKKYGKKWGAKVGHSVIEDSINGRYLYTDKATGEVYTMEEVMTKAEQIVETKYNEPVGMGDIEISITGAVFVETEKHNTYIAMEVSQSIGTKVWSMDITDSMKESVLYEGQPKFQKKKTSNRSLLANALETTAQNDIERKKLDEYKSKIALIESEQAKLEEYKQQANELRFKKGRTAEETKKMRDLDFKANQAANRINTYDRQLLNLESTTALKGVLEREKELVRKRTEAKGREALDAYREKMTKTQRELLTRYKEQRKEQRERATERRDKTTLRRKIRKLVKELNSLFKNGTKKRNIKEEMKGAVASSLALADVLFNDDIKNEDIVRLGVASVTTKESEYLNKYRDLLDVRDSLYAEIESIHGNGMVRETMLEEVGKVEEKLEKVNGQIAYLNNKLSDLFERERARLNKSTVDAIIDELITEYSKLKDSENGYIKNAYSEAMEKRLKAFKEALQGTVAKDMDVYQLQEFYDTFKAIEHMIRYSNSLFRDGRTEDLMTYVSNVQGEIYEASTEQKDRSLATEKIVGMLNEFSWNNLRPVDAVERLGSETFEKLFWDFVHAMGTAARDIVEAGEVIASAREKFGYSKWNMELADTTYTTRDGMKFKPSLADKLSIYAYSQRDQAEDHMVDGGFTYDTGRTYKETKNGKTYVRRKLSNTYRLSKETIQAIIDSLTNEQRSYVNAILPYLTDMGKKGNEVSMTLYGIELFGEKVYFPLQSSRDYLSSTTQTLGATPTMASLANSGFTKQTKPHASNPIVLRGFDDVVLEHIEKMSNYHALVIPIENLRRVFDNVGRETEGMPISTKALIGSRFGVEAQKYFEQWLTDINGGITPSGAKSILGKLFSRAKGTSVAANLSVVAQQYFSIIRAMELVNPKYFTPFLNGEAKKTDMKQYEELLKYAPIAIIKEMNGFDVGSGGRAKDYIGYEGARKDAKYVKKKVDDLWMAGASAMDKLGWVTIWKAVKAEVASEQKLTPGTEAFYEACRVRFTEVVTKTQVYDSVASRSGYMRSQHDSVKYATSFMGEPTAIAGRYFVAGLNLVRAIKTKDKAKIKSAALRLGRVATVIAISNVLGKLAQSLVYAGRDDDEDEAYLERWMRNFAEALADDLKWYTPLNYLPFGRDFVSIMEGWDVDRPDTTLISDMVKSFKKVTDGDLTLDDSLNIIGSVGNFFGQPLKNLIREIKATINVIGDIFDDIHPTDMGGAFVEGFTGEERSKAEMLYESIMSGDTERLEVIKATYKTESAYTSALRTALTENDSRIAEAVMAHYEGDIKKRASLSLEIEKEGNFSQNVVRGAINNEISRLGNKIQAALKAKETDTAEYKKLIKELREMYPKDFVEKMLNDTIVEDEEETASKDISLYKMDDYYDSIVGGNISTANAAKEDIIKTKVANGKDRDEAEESFESDFRSYIGKKYKSGEVSRAEVSNMLTKYGGYDSNETYWKLKEWDFDIENGEDAEYSKYNTFYDAVKTGSNLKSVIKEYTDHGVEKETLARQITSYYKPLYKNMSKSERASLKGYLLNAYALLGYNRYDKSKDIDKWLVD